MKTPKAIAGGLEKALNALCNDLGCTSQVVQLTTYPASKRLKNDPARMLYDAIMLAPNRLLPHMKDKEVPNTSEKISRYIFNIMKPYVERNNCDITVERRPSPSLGFCMKKGDKEFHLQIDAWILREYYNEARKTLRKQAKANNGDIVPIVGNTYSWD